MNTVTLRELIALWRFGCVLMVWSTERTTESNIVFNSGWQHLCLKCAVCDSAEPINWVQNVAACVCVEPLLFLLAQAFLLCEAGHSQSQSSLNRQQPLKGQWAHFPLRAVQENCLREMNQSRSRKMYLFHSCYNDRICQWWKLSRENKFLRVLETRKGEVLNWNSAFSQHIGKAFFPQSKRTTVEAQHLHP